MAVVHSLLRSGHSTGRQAERSRMSHMPFHARPSKSARCTITSRRRWWRRWWSAFTPPGSTRLERTASRSRRTTSRGPAAAAVQMKETAISTSFNLDEIWWTASGMRSGVIVQHWHDLRSAGGLWPLLIPDQVINDKAYFNVHHACDFSRVIDVKGLWQITTLGDDERGKTHTSCAPGRAAGRME